MKEALILSACFAVTTARCFAKHGPVVFILMDEES